MAAWAEKILDLIDQTNEFLDSEAQRWGGYFCLYEICPGEKISPDSPPLFLAKIGNPIPEKVARYCQLCQEKARRLLENPDHLSSWQSRDPGQGKWGGAVRADGLVFSFSGLHEKADEAVVVNLARYAGLLSDVLAQAVAEISDNKMLLS